MIKQVLIIDDHTPIIEGYKSILSFNDQGFILKFHEARDSEIAYNLIASTKIFFDIILLDLSLPPYNKMKINSGEDLIPYIRKQQPQSKIIMVTSHTEQFILYKIYKKLRPEGILIKSDFTPAEFLSAFDTIINGEEYYSATIKETIKKIAANYSSLDNIDMQIITLLSQGIKSKSLAEHLPIGKSAIDKRKLKIKDFFLLERGNDEDIIREARNQKFI